VLMIQYKTLFLIILFIFSTPALAQEQEPESNVTYTGLAMHGQPNHSADDTHLDYAHPDAPKGGALKMISIGTFDTVNPYSIKGVSAKGLNLVYDRLMRRAWNEPFTLYPLIAKYVDVPEDRSSITFYLNPKARFHDGNAITAADVKFSYETLKEKGRPNMRRIYRLVETVTIKGNRITFTLQDGQSRETVMILAMMPVLSKAWWKDRDFDATLLDAPVSNGPYKISEIDPGHRITYERVPDYWAKDLLINQGHYNFDTVVYDYYRDDTIALEAFKKGDANLRREWDITKWESAYADIDKEKIVREAVPHRRPERVHGFIFNMRKDLFKDIRVRKALSMAFDSDWAGKNIYYGKLNRIQSFFPNSALDGSGEIETDTLETMAKWKGDLQSDVFLKTLDITDAKPLRQRLRTANDLLKQAGWIVENGQRVRETTKEPFVFEILLGSAQEEKLALAFTKTLEILGIKANTRTMDPATLQNRRNAYDYDMLMHYWQNSLSPGTEQMVYWSCEAANQPARFNFSGLCNKALDHFAHKIAEAKTYEDLTKYAHAIDRILLSEYITIPLFYKNEDYFAYDKSIMRPKAAPLYGAVMETWWMAP